MSKFIFNVKNAVIRDVLPQDFKGKKTDSIAFVEDIKLEHQDFKDKSKMVLGVAQMKTKIDIVPGVYDIQVEVGQYLSKKNEVILYCNIVKATAVGGAKK